MTGIYRHRHLPHGEQTDPQQKSGLVSDHLSLRPHPAFTLSPSLLLTASDTKVLKTQNGETEGKILSVVPPPAGPFLHGGRQRRRDVAMAFNGRSLAVTLLWTRGLSVLP
ncbi:unnamed protein product [Arctogadus glacialis]